MLAKLAFQNSRDQLQQTVCGSQTVTVIIYVALGLKVIV